MDDWELCGVCLEIVFSVFEDYLEQPDDDEEEETQDDWLEVALDILETEEYQALKNKA